MKRRNFIKYSGTAGLATTLGAAKMSVANLSKRKGLIIEEKREIPVCGEFDVVVCGGGPAGIAAAIEAGRSGAKTMLIENNHTAQPFSLLGIITGVEFDAIKNYARWIGDKGSVSKKNLLAAIQKGGYEPSYRKPSIHPISYNLFKIMANHQYGYFNFY